MSRDVDINNILSLYSTDSVLKRSKVVQAHSIESVYCDTDGVFEFLVTIDEHKLPHSVTISNDDIWCSCNGFLSTFKCKKLCTHLVLCLRELYDKKQLLSEDIVMFLRSWKDRNGSDCE